MVFGPGCCKLHANNVLVFAHLQTLFVDVSQITVNPGFNIVFCTCGHTIRYMPGKIMVHTYTSSGRGGTTIMIERGAALHFKEIHCDSTSERNTNRLQRFINKGIWLVAYSITIGFTNQFNSILYIQFASWRTSF